ncbi:MAG TPA: hypothetical protein VMB49_18515 [Acidobacteriaceae bacterium]|nr:hypothetical protein [Acidobacteriaceae bacterium]
MTRLIVFAIALALSGQTVLDGQTPPPPGLQITILDGEGALNNIKQQTAREPIVQVEDENHKPVAGALVIFSLPQSGPSGTFAGGSTVFDGVSDAAGHATATGLTPNHIAGKYQIQVTAKYHGLTAHATINQSNFSGGSTGAATPAATHAFPLKAVLIVAAVAGAAAIAVVASQSGGGPSNTITAGTPTVGAPSVRRR